ncbi:MAG: maleylpyruvate isomerase family mycothiol-dependent enzyme [Acidimicrobiia bacterium]
MSGAIGPVGLNYDEYVAAIRVEGDALATAAARAGVDAPVPSCPEWTVADLLGHIGRIHRSVAHLVDTRATAWDQDWRGGDPPAPAERVEWFAAGVPLVADALAAAGPGVELYSLTSDQSSGFWARRQAHETAMHRVDAQLAAGGTEPIAQPLAVDGIDEFFDLISFLALAETARGAGETLHFHCTDGPGEWLARLDPDGLVVTREHAKGDVAARGAASDLLLYLHGRGGVDALDVFGDAALLTRWRELVSW